MKKVLLRILAGVFALSWLLGLVLMGLAEQPAKRNLELPGIIFLLTAYIGSPIVAAILTTEKRFQWVAGAILFPAIVLAILVYRSR